MCPRCAKPSPGCATTSSATPSARTPKRRSPRTARTRGPTQWSVPSKPRRAASVNLPMRRTILMALLAALLLTPAASAAGGSRVEILRDCQDDGVLQGDYTASQMRDARSNIPAELDEYSDCRDVLTRAISDKTAPTADSSSTNNGGSSGAGGTGGGSSDDSGSGGGSSGTTTSQPSATSTPA